MLADKFAWSRFNGHWFALFGVGNILCYGLSLFMNEENYKYHFAYTGADRSCLRSLKSQMASDGIHNVGWTAPCLIGLSMYLVPQVGALTMTKFFGLSLACTAAGMTMFNP
jgi:hypothetical protein